MKSFACFILSVTVVACSPLKVINAGTPDRYMITVILHDQDEALNKAATACMQFNPVEPIEINEAGMGSDAVEIKVKISGKNEEHINYIMERLEDLPHIEKVKIQKI